MLVLGVQHSGCYTCMHVIAMILAVLFFCESKSAFSISLSLFFSYSAYSYYFHHNKSMIGVGNGNPLQYSCLEDSMDRGAWQTTVHGVAESDATQHLVCMGTFSYVILVNSYNNPMR